MLFFKQKTAYEMRISDWSSDVCSSDLKRGFGKERFVQQGGMAERFGQRFAAIAGNECKGHAFPRQGCRNLINGFSAQIGVKQSCIEQIGRASCRERGKYV